MPVKGSYFSRNKMVERCKEKEMEVKNRERIVYELCRYYVQGLCSSPVTPKEAPDCIGERCVVFEGYTCQPEPNPASLDELKVPPAETPIDKVEAVAKKLFKIQYPNLEWGHSGTTDDESWRRFEKKCLLDAREILKLIDKIERFGG